MESLASTALYLASSLTVAQAPGTTLPATATMTVAAPAAASVAANPIVSARNSGGKSLSEAIADEVRRDALDRLSVDTDTGVSLDRERDFHEDESLGADVMAAHDARIEFIERRMDEVRLDGASAAPLLEMLGVKLRMAMAARRFAGAREAIGHLPADCSPDTDTCRPVSVVMAANAVADHRGAGHGRPRRSSTFYHRTPADVALAAVHPTLFDRAFPRVSPRVFGGKDMGPVAESRRAPLHRASDLSNRESIAAGAATRLAPSRAVRHRPTDVVVEGSDHARQLLAAARRLLEDDTGHHPSERGAGQGSRSGAKLAGLLHWEGSETWSLANYATSARAASVVAERGNMVRPAARA